ncbi:hypothetical protein BC826DRAFT_996110 [Russula brevipes]|nr:hypothetical protein BC826DRAFT_996110 [Russula brevipes]
MVDCYFARARQGPLGQTSLITRPTGTQMNANINILFSDMILPVQGPGNRFSNRTFGEAEARGVAQTQKR